METTFYVIQAKLGEEWQDMDGAEDEHGGIAMLRQFIEATGSPDFRLVKRTVLWLNAESN